MAGSGGRICPAWLGEAQRSLSAKAWKLLCIEPSQLAQNADAAGEGVNSSGVIGWRYQGARCIRDRPESHLYPTLAANRNKCPDEASRASDLLVSAKGDARDGARSRHLDHDVDALHDDTQEPISRRLSVVPRRTPDGLESLRVIVTNCFFIATYSASMKDIRMGPPLQLARGFPAIRKMLASPSLRHHRGWRQTRRNQTMDETVLRGETWRRRGPSRKHVLRHMRFGPPCKRRGWQVTFASTSDLPPSLGSITKFAPLIARDREYAMNNLHSFGQCRDTARDVIGGDAISRNAQHSSRLAAKTLLLHEMILRPASEASKNSGGKRLQSPDNLAWRTQDFAQPEVSGWPGGAGTPPSH